MPGPPIRKPSDHSPPAGSPRNIAGHHVLHRPLMPRHPPNAQKNKQQRHTNKTRNTLSQKSYSKMLASTIQFTTNPPTPTPHHPHKAAEHRPGNQGALPQNPDSMPPPHTREGTHHHPSGSSRRVSYTTHQTTNHPSPTTQAGNQSTSRPPSSSARASPQAGPDPHGPDNQRPGSHPHTINP